MVLEVNPPPRASTREHLMAALIRLDEGSPRMLVRINLTAAIDSLNASDRESEALGGRLLVYDPPLDASGLFATRGVQDGQGQE